jgi:hypothetical protein
MEPLRTLLLGIDIDFSILTILDKHLSKVQLEE